MDATRPRRCDRIPRRPSRRGDRRRYGGVRHALVALGRVVDLGAEGGAADALDHPPGLVLQALEQRHAVPGLSAAPPVDRVGAPAACRDDLAPPGAARAVAPGDWLGG